MDKTRSSLSRLPILLTIRSARCHLTSARKNIETIFLSMVSQALDELQPYGKPTAVQGHIERIVPGVQLPIIGYYDFLWEDKGLVD